MFPESQDMLAERNVSAYALAKAMGVLGNRILAVLAGKRAVTADTAVRLGKTLRRAPTCG